MLNARQIAEHVEKLESMYDKFEKEYENALDRKDHPSMFWALENLKRINHEILAMYFVLEIDEGIRERQLKHHR